MVLQVDLALIFLRCVHVLKNIFVVPSIYIQHNIFLIICYIIFFPYYLRRIQLQIYYSISYLFLDGYVEVLICIELTRLHPLISQARPESLGWRLGLTPWLRCMLLDYTSRAGWPRRYFCGWIIPARCNYRALKHLMWRGHHFPGRSRSREIGSQRKVTLGTPFGPPKWHYQRGNGNFEVQKGT